MEEASLAPVDSSLTLPPEESPEPGEVEETSPDTSDQAEFDERVAAILSMIQEDPALRDRVLVELYVTVAQFKAEFSAMQEQFSQMGPGGFLKMMMGRG